MCCSWLQFNFQRWAASTLLSKGSRAKKGVDRSSKAIKKKVGDGYYTAQSYLCSKHFKDDCFQPYSKLAEFLRVGKIRVLLKIGAIQTVFERLSQEEYQFMIRTSSKKKNSSGKAGETRVQTHISL